MEEEIKKVSVKNIAIKWGIINGLVGIIFFIVTDLGGLSGNQSLQWLGLLIFAGLLVMAHREYKNEGDGYMTYGQGLGIGTLLALISGFITNVFLFIYISFVNSDFIDVIKERQIMQMENQGMSDAEIEQAMSFSEFFMSPIALSLFGLVGGVFFAFIASLILTIFTKKNSPEFA